MADFNRTRSGGNRSFGKRDFGGNRHMGRPQMYNAVCSNCGKECQVPFKPTGEKPVYCSDCFAKMNGRDSRGNLGRDNRNERPAFHGSHQDNRGQFTRDQQLVEMNEKLNKILELLNNRTPKVAKETPKEDVSTEA